MKFNYEENKDYGIFVFNQDKEHCLVIGNIYKWSFWRWLMSQFKLMRFIKKSGEVEITYTACGAAECRVAAVQMVKNTYSEKK